MNRFELVDTCLLAGGYTLAGLMALETAFLIISFRSWKAVTNITVDGVRYE